jgi:methylated-DNA-[protein]-cysteine S-methyltransferase
MSKPQTLYFRHHPAPGGDLGLAVDADGRVVRIAFLPPGVEAEAELRELHPRVMLVADAERTAELARQLDEYYAGARQRFELELAPEGTDFQQAVWRHLLTIPAGVTQSYGDVARALGRPGAFRAVGRANATNPIPIVVPCHRVIGTDGTLTGFGGGLPRKRDLLRREGVALQDKLF